MLEFARALALGDTPFCGGPMSVPTAARVLLIEQEVGVYGLQRRCRTVFADTAERIGDNLWYVSRDLRLRFDNHDGRQLLHDVVESVKPNVLMLDPIGSFHYYNENDNTDVARLFMHLDLLMEEFAEQHLSVVLSHHFSKPSRDPSFSYDPLAFTNFRGASRWAASPDTLVTIHEGRLWLQPHRHWRSSTRWALRQGAGVPDIQLSFNRDNDLRVRFDGLVGG